MKQLAYFSLTYLKTLNYITPLYGALLVGMTYIAIPASEYLEENTCFIYLSVGVT